MSAQPAFLVVRSWLSRLMQIYLTISQQATLQTFSS